ncbi:hypothetical protein K4K59_007564 [Colletotrichum sp. SAR11_240]|nr:hypothetical protein K4K59_007564 [Colletotrichum sp. SAR11_240]
MAILDRTISTSATALFPSLIVIILHRLDIPTVHTAYRYIQGNVNRTSSISTTLCSRLPIRTSPIVAHSGHGQFEIVSHELKPDRTLEQPNTASLNHYISFYGDAEPALKPFIDIARSQCFAVLFVGVAFLVDVPFAISIFVVVVDTELSYSSVNSICLGECRKPHLNRSFNAVFGSCFQPPFNYFIYFKPQQQLFTPYDESIQYYPRLFVHRERSLLSKSNNTNLAFINCIEPVDRVQLLHTIKLLRHSDSSANLKSLRDLHIECIAHGKLSVQYGFFACLDILARIKFLARTEFLAHNRFFAWLDSLPDDEFVSRGKSFSHVYSLAVH